MEGMDLCMSVVTAGSVWHAALGLALCLHLLLYGVHAVNSLSYQLLKLAFLIFKVSSQEPLQFINLNSSSFPRGETHNDFFQFLLYKVPLKKYN